MRILHIGDIHCNIKYLRHLSQEVQDEEIDLIAIDGDVECNGEILRIIEGLGKNIVFVPGNMDDVAIAKLYAQKGYNIDANIKQLNDYTIIAGIGGLSIYSSLNTIKKKLGQKPYTKMQKIILAHHPPKTKQTDLALGRVHAGLKELTDLILEYKPILYMHGHIHEALGHEYIGETLIVNAGPLAQGKYAVIDLNKKTVEHRTITIKQ